jgi:hypothetical protein
MSQRAPAIHGRQTSTGRTGDVTLKRSRLAAEFRDQLQRLLGFVAIGNDDLGALLCQSDCGRLTNSDAAPE